VNAPPAPLKETLTNIIRKGFMSWDGHTDRHMLFGIVISRNQILASLWLVCPWFKNYNNFQNLNFTFTEMRYFYCIVGEIRHVKCNWFLESMM